MNNPQTYPTKATVFAYFAHQATPLERQQVEAWLKTSEGITLYFTYLDEWERHHPQFLPELDQPHQHFLAFMRESDPRGSSDPGSYLTDRSVPEVSTDKQPFYWFRSNRWLSIAATILLIAGLWFSTDLWYYQTWTNSFRQLRTIKLPDGSTVELGANSSLRYPRFGFGWGTRYVWLTGEAEFQVAHLPEARRFRVHTPDQTVIDVLGTVFVVNSRRNATRVMLKTGRIRLSNPMTPQPLTLVPGDLVTISTEHKVQKKQLPTLPAQVTWHNHQFIFQDTPLRDIVTQLHDTFGVRVHIQQPDLLNRTVSGTFQAETADDLLQALKLMMNLEINHSPSGFTLTQSVQ